MSYFVYIVRCKDGTLYSGVTNDLAKRLHAHNHLKSGAKYTRSRRPVVLAYAKRVKTKSAALKQEAKFQALTRKEKLALVAAGSLLKRKKSG